MHAMHAKAHLFAKVSAVVVSGFRIGHFKDGRERRRAPRHANLSQGLLVGEAGLAEMHLTVETPGSTCRPRQSTRLPADQRKDRRSQRSSPL